MLDREVLPHFGDVRLSKRRREDIERWHAERLAGKAQHEGEGEWLSRGKRKRARARGVQDSTVNKELMRLKHLLNRAVAWGYLRDSPARMVKKVKGNPGPTVSGEDSTRLRVPMEPSHLTDCLE